MKRTLLQRGAIIAACAAAFVLGGCGDTEFDSRTDTVYSLETPQVTAKAYPGVNVVSWKPVTGASEYAVTMYEEGVYKWAHTYPTADTITDTKLVNGKTYTYSVEAKSTTNPGTLAREVYATNSRGEASVKAIVPPVGTKSLELPAYENGYDGKTAKEVTNKEWVLDKDKIKAFKDGTTIYVEFPMKAYLTYTVKYYDNEYDEGRKDGTTATIEESISDINANDVTGHASFAITDAGTYQIAVVANAYNTSYYAASAEVKYGTPITIESLGLSSETVMADPKYLSDGKTARISFEPAKKDGVYVDTSWYRVYRRVKGEYATTEVSNDGKNIEKNVSAEKDENNKDYTKKTYYIDDNTITNNKQVYEYIVVVTDGTKYGTAQRKELSIVTDLSLDSETGPVTAKYLYDVNHFAASADNTVRIWFKPAQKDGKPVSTDKYKVYRSESDSLVQTEVTSDTNKIMVEKDNKDSSAYVIYDKISDPAKSYVYTVVVEEGGNFKAKKGTLDAETEPTFIIYKPTSKVQTAYNDIKWTFEISSFSFDSKDVKKVKNIKAYLLVTKTTQEAPKANEIIATGTEFIVSTKDDSSTDTYYIYNFSKSNISDGDANAYVVVTATCDGYENAISPVSTTLVRKTN